MDDVALMIKGCQAGLVILDGPDGYQALEIDQWAGTHNIECPE